jgi:DNA (cytosine-5)-methyltransferase 1
MKISRARKIVAVDLFCGAGGLTHGLEKAGVPVAFGVDIDPACEYPYQQNNDARFVLRSVEDVSGNEITDAFGCAEFSVLAGCAPCQPFSKYRLGKSDSTDGRWNLLQHFQRLVEETRPTVVTMENVPRLAEQAVFQNFVGSLQAAGYHTSHQVVRCVDYGVPQLRERLVLLASRLGPITLIPPTHSGKKRVTVRKAIGRMPAIGAGETFESDPLHQACELSPLNIKRIKASRPGGSWRDWKESLVADCHKKKSGKTYPSVYGRMVWDEPAPTMTTQFFGFGNGRFGHPDQDRAISLREGAIFQSFPRHYEFAPPGQRIFRKTVGRLIGNAVPVKLGEAIGRSIVRHIAAIKSTTAS